MSALLASALPENTGDGYVAGAYIVFFVLVLVYVAIMAVRLGRVERTVRKLQEEERLQRDRDGASESALTGTGEIV
jgi:hypothetical protein